MPTDLRIQCHCGAFRAIAEGVSASVASRLVCYCDDCQAFAHFLDRTDETLDDQGGSDIVQMSAARMRFEAGRDQVACIRLTPKGILRWYAQCCGTPIGNTVATHQLPFVGLINVRPKGGPPRFDEAAVGPPVGRVFGRFAQGEVREAGMKETGLSWPVIGRFIRIIGGARLRGDHRRSPFFDAESGAPIVPPRVLRDEELAAAQAQRDGA